MRKRRLLRIILNWGVVGLLGIQWAHAGDVITVDSVGDQPQAGLTTLREAIELANTMGNAEIVFDPAVFSTPQTIILGDGDMTITKPMKIFGSGTDLLTIDADNQSRIFTLNDGNGQGAFTVTISGITFTNGNGESAFENGIGGCIYSHEKLQLFDSVIKNCHASQDAGGVFIHRALNVIENSLFLNNTAGRDGGGVGHSGSVNSRIVGSTFIGNTAGNGGGAIHVIQTGSFEVINSTITNNQANIGAGIRSTSALNINNSTIVDNLGEGVNLKQDNIQNSIIAGNTSGDCFFSETGFTNVHNLDSDGSCGGAAPLGHITVADPMLEPLANYGGLTSTYRPLPGSPVIDAGDDLTCDVLDQRGISRPQNGDNDDKTVCDIGAVELAEVEDVIYLNGFD